MTPEETKGLTDGIKSMQDNLKKIEDTAKLQGEAGEKALKLAEEAKSALEAIETKMKGNITADEAKSLLKEHGETMQKQFDELATKIGKGMVQTGERKSLTESMMEGVKEFFPDHNGNPLGLGAATPPQGKLLKMFQSDRHAKITIPLFANTILPTAAEIDHFEQKVMTLGTNLTGPAYATQDPRMVIFPSQKINVRDLVPTFQTDTGYYVYWKEDTGETNNIAFQVEGSDKPENSYSLTGTGIVEQFLSGVTTFSKQFVNNLPFITQYLPMMLMRDFYKKENASGYSVMATGTGPTNISSTADNVIAIIRYIAKQLTGDYDASFGIVTPTDYATLIESTYTKGYYPGAGAVTYNGTSLQLDGVPIIRATWATTGKVVIIDRMFMQRVQCSGLAIELSYENDKNFTKNLITARIECQEQFVLQLLPSAIYGNLS